MPEQKVKKKFDIEEFIIAVFCCVDELKNRTAFATSSGVPARLSVLLP
ncbi:MULTISPECIES: hypothetical protein [Cyanophyceae]|nr:MULTISPECIES: hypothetical protein [Cyanophyceae]MBD1919392.1 hypothetical protein [Phormidium sp. FACHB-77]MBD2054402.1 hypothetical protein [Leptolyngbya sp. FACHB-60]